VPTSAEWTAVNANNTASRTGTFSNNATNYGVALHYGSNASSKTLTLPAAGFRRYDTNGTLVSRGNYGYYWSSTENLDRAYTLEISSSTVNPAYHISGRTSGTSVRCITE
jgi:uncharacterized protein (TIGR02145 family)